MAIASPFKALCLSLLFIAVASRPTVRQKVFNVDAMVLNLTEKLITPMYVFTNVWKSACARSGSSKIYVPKGTFYLGGVEFVGHAKIRLNSSLMELYWLLQTLEILSRTLGSTSEHGICIREQFKNRWDNITQQQNGTLNFFSVHHFNITGVTVTAPGDSPNTDGIKFGFCSNIRISNTNIVFNGTSDGIRIKTWESSAAKIVASNFVFENIQMINVGKPINIDQKYCPYPPCEKTGASHVQIKDIKYKNIYGTSKNKVAVNLQCSKSFRCKNVELIDINLEHNGVEGGPSTCPYPPCEKTGASHVQIKDIKYKNIYGTSKNKVAVNLQCSKSFRCKNVELIDINLEHNGVEGGPSTAVCENVDGSARGKMVPQHCLA
ncbi:unnamed protein product [Microthlaspi erraticum]|uniref:Pectate lyase superfamily protein domain-containing protein n=1 Tax=Microthlaspi erraticum TaxID=1685480 RepID=A0A6D2KTH2_9BRAS|nr:unnamed protein product [Microthlaspi erraticum]